MSRIDKFNIGDPLKLPVIRIPPDTVNNAKSNTRNGINSLRETSKM